MVKPPYDAKKTYDCKWELDSLASFLQISSEYYNLTGDMGPFTKYKWAETVGVILDSVEAMRTATYTPEGECITEGAPKVKVLTGIRAYRSQRLHHDWSNEPRYRNYIQ